MKNDTFKALMEKSIITTSEDFTTKVVSKIEPRLNEQKYFVFPFKIISLGLVLLLITISYIIFKSANISFVLLSGTINIPKNLFFVIITILLFSGLNYMLVLNKKYQNLKNSV